jgi:cytochrome c oxidase assembly protein subunit 11
LAVLRKNKRLTLLLVGLVLFMIGLSFASVPLYRIFCQRTGYGGTTQVAVALPDRISKRLITIRFNANVGRELPWSFTPLQKEVRVRAGEQAFAVYHVRNISDKPLVGMATYNVTPDKAGPYFQKVECFCFLEQRLNAHQSIDMPLLFFIDPAIDEDPALQDLDTLTLSYTFFPFQGEIPKDPYGKK